VRSELEKYIFAQITEAKNGTEALDLLGQEFFDIVISDQWMEKICGTDLLGFIEKNPERVYHFVLFSSDQDLVLHLKSTKRCPAILKSDFKALASCVIEACCINLLP